mgnify:CR=1 FL=1
MVSRTDFTPDVLRPFGVSTIYKDMGPEGRVSIRRGGLSATLTLAVLGGTQESHVHDTRDEVYGLEQGMMRIAMIDADGQLVIRDFRERGAFIIIPKKWPHKVALSAGAVIGTMSIGDDRDWLPAPQLDEILSNQQGWLAPL